MPEYTLDFGFVIKGSIVTHIVKITNTCPLAVSFKADKSSLAGTGWSVLQNVKKIFVLDSNLCDVFRVFK